MRLGKPTCASGDASDFRQGKQTRCSLSSGSTRPVIGPRAQFCVWFRFFPSSCMRADDSLRFVGQVLGSMWWLLGKSVELEWCFLLPLRRGVVVVAPYPEDFGFASG